MSERILYLDEAGYRHEPLRWAWALGALYNLYHEFPVDLPLDAETAARDYTEPTGNARLYIDRDWGVSDRAGLVGKLNDLGRHGERRAQRHLVRRLCAYPGASWEEHEAQARAAYEQGNQGAAGYLWRMWAVHKELMGCRTASFLAFDAARAAQLARCGQALGWLSAEETRAYVYDLARETSATFTSWQDYAADFEVGRAFWAGRHEADTWPRLQAMLLADERSPWRRLPFAFPEDETSRAIGAADTRAGPCWPLEPAPHRGETAAAGPGGGAVARGAA